MCVWEIALSYVYFPVCTACLCVCVCIRVCVEFVLAMCLRLSFSPSLFLFLFPFIYLVIVCRRVCVWARVCACVRVFGHQEKTPPPADSPPRPAARLRSVSSTSCDDCMRLARDHVGTTSKISSSIVTPEPGNVRWVYEPQTYFRNCAQTSALVVQTMTGVLEQETACRRPLFKIVSLRSQRLIL